MTVVGSDAFRDLLFDNCEEWKIKIKQNQPSKMNVSWNEDERLKPQAQNGAKK